MGGKFKHVRPLTDEEEAQIQKQIASDPDAPEATDEQIARAKPFAEAFPDLAESIKRSRGRPRIDSPKEAVTLRIDPNTIARFKAGGEDWRAKMEQVTGLAELIVAKQRHGSTGRVRMRFEARITRFSDLAHDDMRGQGYDDGGE